MLHVSRVDTRSLWLGRKQRNFVPFKICTYVPYCTKGVFIHMYAPYCTKGVSWCIIIASVLANTIYPTYITPKTEAHIYQDSGSIIISVNGQSCCQHFY